MTIAGRSRLIAGSASFDANVVELSTQAIGHSVDAQIEPGFDGKITFELCNLASFGVKLKAGQEVAQLFICKTTTRKVKPYNGRYQGATGPTVHRKKV